jgi:ribose transport system substrate-binding protein
MIRPNKWILVPVVLILLISGCTAAPTATPAPAPVVTSAPVAPATVAPAATQAATAAPAAKTAITIGLSWNRKDLQLITAWEDYMKKIAADPAVNKGININWVVNVADGDVTRQASNIEDLISQKVDVIVARAEDSAAICASIKAAKAAGIPFVTFDREANGCYPDAHVGADTYNQAVTTGNAFADLLVKNNVKGKCIELVGDYRDQNAVNRTNGWADVEKARGAWETVLKVPTEYDPAKFTSGTVDGFTSHPEANCMFITTDEGWGIVQNGLQEIGKLAKSGEPGHVWIASQDVGVPGYAGLMDGYMDVSTSYDAFYQSQGLVNAAYVLATGGTLDKTVILVQGRVVTDLNVRDTPDLYARDYGDYKGK